jgi:Holliday junction resolvase
MVKKYAKGYRAEWHLLHALAKRDFMVLRAPRSGRIGLPSPDIIAVKDGRVMVFECKSREDAFSVQAEQLEELRQWEQKAGAFAYLAWKVSRQDWVFLTLRDVMNNNGNVGKKFALEKGISMDTLLCMDNSSDASAIS